MKNKLISRLPLFLLITIICIMMSPISAFAATDNELSEQTTDIANFKNEVVDILNAEREKNGIKKFKTVNKLTNIANVRASESATLFSHTRPNYTKCFTIFKDYSLNYRTAGENLAYGLTTPEKLVSAWMNSPGHRANILDKDLVYVGVGYYTNENGRLYCSLLFYTPKS